MWVVLLFSFLFCPWRKITQKLSLHRQRLYFVYKCVTNTWLGEKPFTWITVSADEQQVHFLIRWKYNVFNLFMTHLPSNSYIMCCILPAPERSWRPEALCPLRIIHHTDGPETTSKTCVGQASLPLLSTQPNLSKGGKKIWLMISFSSPCKVYKSGREKKIQLRVSVQCRRFSGLTFCHEQRGRIEFKWKTLKFLEVHFPQHCFLSLLRGKKNKIKRSSQRSGQHLSTSLEGLVVFWNLPRETQIEMSHYAPAEFRQRVSTCQPQGQTMSSSGAVTRDWAASLGLRSCIID